LLTGKFFSAAQQGFYSRGKDYGMLPSGILISILSKSYFPIFSRLQDEPAPLKKNYLNALSAVSFIGGLIFPLLFLVAGDAVVIVLRDKWLDMIPVLEMFIVFSAVHVFNSVNSNFLAATGKAKTNLFILFVMGCVRMAAVLLYFVITPGPDMLIVIAMLIMFSFAENHLTFFFIRKYNGYSMARQYGASYKEMITGWFIAGVLYFLSGQVEWLSSSALIHLLAVSVLFVLLYAAACYFTRSFYFVNWFSRLRLVK
jgi:O-antigen/teichoic acid export membrane protein